jgi:hypothetical protein
MAAHRPEGEGCFVLIDARMGGSRGPKATGGHEYEGSSLEDDHRRGRGREPGTRCRRRTVAGGDSRRPRDVSAGLSASDLAKLPLTDRHLTKREKANLAVVLRAYHVAEGNSLEPQAFMDLFARDGVLNGIGGEDGQDTLRGQQLGDLVVWMGGFLPDIHRNLKQITVRGDVVSIELSIQGTFLGPFSTPAGAIKPTGAKIAIPTADFWYLRNGKVEVFDCHIGFTALYAQLGILPDYASAVGN